ncbi:hypothetical protein [Nocardioides sp. Leaf307]|uniref:hypothetical protein n=1 Tax=Nocardioides sp. Leaf307 TaxID=1736331 RepID=UPI000702E474|nr:hypothetical protein [Nocardioides sp. Leaf307]KQQ39763.1 hypothetical protein ASF50_18095 [Nocardioides sp. Leaf307]
MPYDAGPVLGDARRTLRPRDPDADLKSWQIELDRVELDVMRAERGLAHGAVLQTDPWHVPDDHGPLPEALRERAEEIHARQQVVLAAIAETLGRTLRQQAVATALDRSSARHSGPVYVDVSA